MTQHGKLLGAVLLLGSLAACSKGTNANADSASGSISPSAAAMDTGVKAPVIVTGIKIADNAKVGRYLTDANGRALYLFTKDKKDSSTCTGKCAKAWPAYTEAQATTGSDASLDKAKISTIARPGGMSQVSYNGHPLYLFDGDKTATDINGQDKKSFGGEWYLVGTDGDKIEHAPGMKAAIDTAMNKTGKAIDTAVQKTKRAVKKHTP
jgi:predicted lipoprotein with Yx(FWY)xxD motif